LARRTSLAFSSHHASRRRSLGAPRFHCHRAERPRRILHRDVGGRSPPLRVPCYGAVAADGAASHVTTRAIDEYELGPMPADRRFATTDALLVRAPRPMIFSLAADVERWPALLPH